MVVCGGVWWFAVVCGGLRWFVVVCGGLRWFVFSKCLESRVRFNKPVNYSTGK